MLNTNGSGFIDYDAQNYTETIPDKNAMEFDRGTNATADPTNSTQVPLPGRHLGGGNILFADGHVKWVTPNQVSPGLNAVHATDAEVTTGANGNPAAGTASAKGSFTFSVI